MSARYEVVYSRTCKPAFAPESERWMQLRREVAETFDTLDGAREYLRDRYGKCKRTAMYVDTKSGETKRVGTVYKFNEREGGRLYNIEEWVEVRRVESETVFPVGKAADHA